MNLFANTFSTVAIMVGIASSSFLGLNDLHTSPLGRNRWLTQFVRPFLKASGLVFVVLGVVISVESVLQLVSIVMVTVVWAPMLKPRHSIVVTSYVSLTCFSMSVTCRPLKLSPNSLPQITFSMMSASFWWMTPVQTCFLDTFFVCRPVIEQGKSILVTKRNSGKTALRRVKLLYVIRSTEVVVVLAMVEGYKLYMVMINDVNFTTKSTLNLWRVLSDTNSLDRPTTSFV